MLPPLFLFLLPLAGAPTGPDASGVRGAEALHAAPQDLEEEFKRRLDEVKEDYAALWKLVDWCEANSLTRSRTRALLQVIKLEPDDAKARALLGHVRFDGQWFTSQRRADAYRKKADAAREKAEAALAREKGWVRWNERWVDPVHVPLLEQGLTLDDGGEWLNAEELALRADGWQRQDLTWIPREEYARVLASEWKCGERWLSAVAADEYHAEVRQPWRIPTAHFHLWTTLPREFAGRALANIDDAYRDLVRLYGIEPAQKPVVLVLRSLRQYQDFAQGKYGGGQRGYDLRGVSSLHGAFFADGWLERGTRTYRGAGVGAWDFQSSVGASFGRLFARHAAGLSFAEAIDPSPEAVASYFDGTASREPRPGPPSFPVEAFWDEKLIPAWFRFGAASYVERYFTDSFIDPDGDPRWTIKWAVENLARRGGLGKLDPVFAFELSLDDVLGGEKRISEAGLLVAFVADGDVPSLQRAHADVRAALQTARREPKARSNVREAFERLAKEITRNEKALRAFAGIE